MNELTLAVVGIDFPNRDKTGTNRRSEAMMCVPGEPVELRPEPRNAHDPHAVGVWSKRGIQLGYLTAERAPWIGRRLRGGEELAAVFQGISGPAAAIRVRFGGGSPTLPAESDEQGAGVASGEGGFFADPPASDWGA